LLAIAQKMRASLATPQVHYWACIFLFVVLNCLVDSPSLFDRPGESWMWFWLPMAVAINADKLAEGD
jgi:hypothetical protein